jgi:hypothetical protein
VWAVGDGESLHWDGSRWRHVTAAGLHDAQAQLFGLAQFGGADVWTAGYVPRRGHAGSCGTVQRWDGTVWTDLPLPAVASSWSLAGVGGVSGNDLWAVGQIWQLVKDDASVWGIGYAPDSTPIVARMTHAAWRSVPGPPPPPGVQHSSLHGGAILPDGGLLVVGATSASPGTAQPFAAGYH